MSFPASKKIDRGGLFEVNDGCYHLFAAIEIALGDKLKVHLQSSTTQHSLAKSSPIQSISCDEVVQFYWAMQSVDIDNDEHSAELLHHIIELGVTVRGFSIGASCLEDYERVMNTSTLKSTGLRKGLKKKLVIARIISVEFLIIRTPPFPAKDANFRTLIHSYTYNELLFYCSYSKNTSTVRWHSDVQKCE